MIPNPPAFPTAADDTEGMTLRDWFAGQALAGLYAKYGCDNRDEGDFASDAAVAFNIADAMLAVRSAT